MGMKKALNPRRKRAFPYIDLSVKIFGIIGRNLIKYHDFMSG
jgi:hypothetical protein